MAEDQKDEGTSSDGDDTVVPAWPSQPNPFEPAEPARPVQPSGASRPGGPPPPPRSPSFPPPPPPPFLYYTPLPGTQSPRRRGRGPLLVALAGLVVAAVGAGVLVLVGDDEDRNPEEALSAAQAMVADASSFRFTYTAEDTSIIGSDDLGSETTNTYKGEGEWSGERWRMLNRDGYGESETILDGDTAYDRWVESGGDLSGELWTRWEDARLTHDELLEVMSEDLADDALMGEGWADTMAVMMAVSLYLGDVEGSVAPDVGFESGFTGDPGGFLLAIDEMADPVAEGQSADVFTLSATVQAPEDFVEAFDAPLPDGKVELDVDSDDVPMALRLDVAQGESSFEVEIAFSDWNGPVEIQLPDDDEIDEFPGIDEDAVREAAGQLALHSPTSLPDNWELSYLEVVEPDLVLDTSEDSSLGECTTVEIDWDEVLDADASDEDWEDAGYLWLYQFSTDCALRSDQTPFEPGLAGLPTRETEYYGLREVQIGDTVVGIETNLDDAELEPIVASLQPADVEALIDEAKATFAGYE